MLTSASANLLIISEGSMVGRWPRYIERHLPITLGAASLAGTLWCLRGAAESQAQPIPPEMFSATFDTATFASGILFTIYILALTPNGTFIERMLGTKTFALFHRYVSIAILSSACLASFSLVYLVSGSTEVLNESSILLISLWVAIAAYTSACILRVIFVFLALVGGHSKPRRQVRRKT